LTSTRKKKTRAALWNAAAVAIALAQATPSRAQPADRGTAAQQSPGEFTVDPSRPEQALGELITANFVTMKSAGQCPQPGYADRLKCLARLGWSLQTSVPDECRLTMVERRTAEGPRKWDGTPDGSTPFPLARELTVDLRSLNESQIKLDPFISLRFDLTKSSVPAEKVLLWGSPNVWIAVVSPPIEDDLTATYPDPAARERELMNRSILWSSLTAPLREGRLLQNATLSPSGLEIQMSPPGMIFLGRATPAASQQYVVGVLKALLAKCHR
jgi:hypothetical protein